jgi:DNA-binding winged helix-turn-helix (wHTH) protein/tetratricopeptide (TPR) repeat protein
MTSAPLEGKALYEFGPFRLDASQRVLVRDGELIPMAPKTFETLQALVEAGGLVVEKDDLIHKVWPETFVEEGSLTQNISILRKLLGESDGQRYIQTIPKRGYRFVAKVTVPATPLTPVSNSGDVAGNGSRIPLVKSRGRQRAIAGSAVAAVIASIGILSWYRVRTTPLTGQDVVVLADFTNSTGEPVFDGTLREVFAYQLEQSPFLKVLDDAVMRQDLELMRRSPTERITNELAHDICVREADRAMLDGSIASLGKDYVVDVKATSCETGATLARAQAEAPDKEHVLQAMAAVTQGMRAKLGESLSSIQKFAPPAGLERVTTASLEAFQAYHIGRNLFNQSRFVEAIPFLRRATELDPELAFAWAWLATATSSSGGDLQHVQEYEDRAWALRDRVSKYERFWLSSSHYMRTGQRNQAAEIYEIWERTYPRDPAPLVMLGLTRAQMGLFEEALRYDLAGYQASPRQPLYAGDVMNDYIRLDRFAEAKAVAEKHFAQGFDNPQIHRHLLRIAYAQGDPEGAAKQIEWLRGKPEEYLGLEDQAEYARMVGQLGQSQKLLQTAADLARRKGLTDATAHLSAPDAAGDALLGNCQTTRETNATSPAALAFCGNADVLGSAEKRAEEIARERPNDNLWQAARLPLIQAAVEFKRALPEKAIQLLQSASQYERVFPFAIYLRGLAYLRLGRGTEAAAEFQKIADHPGTYWGPMYPLSYLGLARGAAAAHDLARARAAYLCFLSLWRNADPDEPVLLQARKEYAELLR